jgi:hypothetical protein
MRPSDKKRAIIIALIYPFPYLYGHAARERIRAN